MATYTKGLSVANAVSAQSSGGSGTLYTCPANSYAILNIHVIAGFNTNISNTILVGGRLVMQAGAGSLLSSHLTNFICFHVYVGPGQAVTYTDTGGSSISISGVEFANQA